MRKLNVLIASALIACGAARAAVVVDVDWANLKDIEKTSDGYKAVKWDPFLISAPIKTPVAAETPYLALTVEFSRPVVAQLWWGNAGQDWDGNRCADVHVPAGESTVYVSLLALGYFEAFDTFRFDPGNDAGVEFNLKEIQAMSASELPQEKLVEMVDFHAFTSKLHYRPGERIEYGARLNRSGVTDSASFASHLYGFEELTAEFSAALLCGSPGGRSRVWHPTFRKRC